MLADSVTTLRAVPAQRLPVQLADHHRRQRVHRRAPGRSPAMLAATIDGVRAIHLDQKGRGRALRTAWTDNDATIVAYMDVDLSTDLDALPAADRPPPQRPQRRRHRVPPRGRVHRRPWAPPRVHLPLVQHASCAPCSATASATPSAASRPCAATWPTGCCRWCEDNEWFFDTELLLLAERNGLRVHEVPVTWIDDPDSRVHVVSTAQDDLKGVARLARSFVRGRRHGGPRSRRPRRRWPTTSAARLVVFAEIGVVSTLISLVLFLLLRGSVGAVWANLIAVGATALGNTWANRRYTFGYRDSRAARSPLHGWRGDLAGRSRALQRGPRQLSPASSPRCSCCCHRGRSPRSPASVCCAIGCSGHEPEPQWQR